MSGKKYYHLSCEITLDNVRKMSCTSILVTDQPTSETGLATWLMKKYEEHGYDSSITNIQAIEISEEQGEIIRTRRGVCPSEL